MLEMLYQEVFVEAFKLVIVFFVIVALLHWRKPLPVAIAGGILSTCFLYGLGVSQSVHYMFQSITGWPTLSLLLVFYCIMFLQRMLEKRDCLIKARNALDGISANRRVNTALAPMFIGLLPSAAAMLICGSIVNSYCKEHLKAEERTLITTYFRHIPESFVPTYTSIILGVELSGLPLASFIVSMLPMVAVLIALGYYFLLRDLPVTTGRALSDNKWAEFAQIGKSLWTLALIVALVIVLNAPVWAAAGFVIVLNVVVDRFSWQELKPMFVSSFESRMLLTTALIMVFKDIIGETGVIEVLPELFAALPIPPFFAFFLIFFFGTIVSGQQAMTAIAIPLAFATIPDGGTPLLMLLLSAGYIAMQISPTHICLAVVTEYFHTSMSALIRRTLPIVGSFVPILLGYYLLLTAF